mgnify:CR=1 FL=1
MKKLNLFTFLFLVTMTVLGQAPMGVTKMKFSHIGTDGPAFGQYTVVINSPVELTIVADSYNMETYYINDDSYYLTIGVPETIILAPGTRFSLELFNTFGSDPYYFDGLSTGFVGDFAPGNWSEDFSLQSELSFEAVLPEPPCVIRAKRNNFEWIESIKVGGVSFSSGKNENAYGDYTETPLVIEPAEVLEVELTPGYKNRNYTEYWRIWIDINNDGDYSDEGEMVFETKGKGMVEGNIPFPDGLVSPDVRVKVAMSWKNYPPYCGSFNSGEVEEYTWQLAIP